MNAVAEGPANVGLGSWQAVRLIAGRELTTRLRSKAFVITTTVMLVLLIGFAVVLKFISGSGISAPTVGFTSQNASLASAIAGQRGGRWAEGDHSDCLGRGQWPAAGQ